MTGKRFMPQMLILLGFITLILAISIMLPGWVEADANITLNESPDQVVTRGGADSHIYAAIVNDKRNDNGTTVTETNTIIISAADFNFTKTTNTPVVLINSDVVFTLVLTNTGTETLTPNPLQSEDPLCDDPAFLSNPSGDGGTPGILDVGETWSINCTVPNVTADFTNVATVTFIASDVQIQKVASASVNVVDPSIQITKNPDTQTINSGQTATFNITVQNTSNDLLTDVEVTDSLASDCNKNYTQIGAGVTQNYSCTVDDVREGFINSAMVTGTPLVGPDVTDADAAEVLLTDVVNACPTDMAAYWKLDDTGGAPYDDYYSGHDGVCAGNCPASLLKGRVNGAQTFDGSSTGISIPIILGDDFFNWGGNDSFSLEVWMKGDPGSCTGSEVQNNEVIIGRDDSNSNLHWWFGCDHNNQQARFRLGDTTGDYVDLRGKGPIINDGTWHHLVGIRDGINGVNRLYVDGVEVDSVTKTYAAGFDSPSAGLDIGWLNLGGGFRFEGVLDEIAIYNKTLSPSEIAEHYHNGMPGPGYCGGPYAPTIISTPVTFAEPEEPYTYSVEAVGDPNPTYALTITPTGMIINSTTGEITWTPTSEQVGTHDVQVEARNSAGTDLQDFIIGISSGGVYLPIIMR